MEIIENWAEIVGILIGILPAPERDGMLEMHLRVEEVRAVEPFPNMIRVNDDGSIAVLIRPEQVPQARPDTGSDVAIRIRAAGPPPLLYFAHPDWHF